MKLEYLHLVDGPAIPVHVARNDGNLLLELREPGPFLDHLPAAQARPVLPPDAYLRGVVFPGREAVFQLFDQFGTASDEIRLTADEARALLQGLW